MNTTGRDPFGSCDEDDASVRKSVGEEAEQSRVPGVWLLELMLDLFPAAVATPTPPCGCQAETGT
jgi:hypothetical protein